MVERPVGHELPGDLPPARDGGISPAGRRSRTYTKIILAVVATVAVADLLLLGLGFVDRTSFRDWGTGALIALLGALVWEAVEHRTRSDGRIRSSAWVAFPLAIFLAFASLPFFAMSVYPPLRDELTASGRIEGRWMEKAGVLELFFPRPVLPGDINLKLGPVEITSDAAKKNPEAFQWKGPRTLRVDLRRLEKPALADLAVVGINMIQDSPRFRYETQEVVPLQRVQVRR